MSIEDLVLDQLDAILASVRNNDEIDRKMLENALLEAIGIIRA